jgi:hypothetical protein
MAFRIIGDFMDAADDYYFVQKMLEHFYSQDWVINHGKPPETFMVLMDAGIVELTTDGRPFVTDAGLDYLRKKVCAA